MQNAEATTGSILCMLISRSKQFRNQVQNCIGKAGLEKMHRLQVAHLSLKFCLTWAFWNANLKGWWAHQWTIRSQTSWTIVQQYLIATRICNAFAYLHIFQDLNLLYFLLASYSATAFHQVLTANLPALQQQLLPWLEAATSMRLEMLSFSKSFLVKRNPAKFIQMPVMFSGNRHVFTLRGMNMFINGSIAMVFTVRS